MPTTARMEAKAARKMGIRIAMVLLFDFDHVLENACWKLDARSLDAVAKFGANAGRFEAASNAAIAGQTHTLEDKNILRCDHFAFHPQTFGDVSNFARSVVEA